MLLAIGANPSAVPKVRDRTEDQHSDKGTQSTTLQRLIRAKWCGVVRGVFVSCISVVKSIGKV